MPRPAAGRERPLFHRAGLLAVLLLVCGCLLPPLPTAAQPDPGVHAITGARLVTLAGATIESGTITGYAAITSIDIDPDTGEAFGFATDHGAIRRPWGITRYEEEIEHRTSDENPANTSVTGRYSLSQELENRTLDFEQTVEFRSDFDNFYLKFHRWLDVDGELYREKTWEETIPRDFQ